MGCHASVVVIADNENLAGALGDTALRRIAHLERCWTRFDGHSDLSALNSACGHVVEVDSSTVDLLQAMLLAYRLTSGRCNSFHRTAVFEPASLEDVLVDDHRHLIRLPEGLELDPGSIGKGLAADLVCSQLLDRGARGALVEIGGDLRVVGEGPHYGFWNVSVADPFAESQQVQTVHVRDAGVATSGLELSNAGEGPVNVSINSRTGAVLDAATHPVVSATVVAGTALEAEMWSTALLVGDSFNLEPVVQRGCLARVTLPTGERVTTRLWEQVVTNYDSHSGADDV